MLVIAMSIVSRVTALCIEYFQSGRVRSRSRIHNVTAAEINAEINAETMVVNGSILRGVCFWLMLNCRFGIG